MLYRPVFCCNCGEKIVRDEWRLWTSRRFCALCATEHQGAEFLPKAIVGIGALAIIFSVASSIRGPNYSRDAAGFPTQQTKVSLKPPSADRSTASDAGKAVEPLPRNIDPQPNTKAEINEQPQREKRSSEETVYYCGAITKKGTPCTRRVKTKGFCWQHAKSGQIAPARF